LGALLKWPIREPVSSTGDILMFGHLRGVNRQLWDDGPIGNGKSSIFAWRPDVYFDKFFLTVRQIEPLVMELGVIAGGEPREPSMPTSDQLTANIKVLTATALLQLDMFCARLKINLGEAVVERFNALAAEQCSEIRL
jgi:hypothetical protein